MSMSGVSAAPASGLDLLGSLLDRLLENSSRKHQPIKDAIAEAQAHIRQIRQAGTPLTNADMFFYPFKLACESKANKLVAMSIDGLHQLMAAKFLTGSSENDPDRYPPPQNARHYKLIDAIINTIYACGSIPDDLVQLQVLKALLTAISSPVCEVHDQSLMLAVRACYHIFLSTRNLVNQTTARATLTQMLSIVFNRMETTTEQYRNLMALNEEKKIEALLISPVSASIEVSEISSTKNSAVNEHKELLSPPDEVSQSDPNEVSVGPTEAPQNGQALAAEAPQNGQPVPAEATQNGQPEPVQAPQSKPAPLEADGDDKNEDSINMDASLNLDSANPKPLHPREVEEKPAKPGKGKYGWCIACGKTADNYCLQTQDPICSNECKKLNLDRKLRASDESEEVLKVRLATHARQLQNDAFLLFRALCKLSGKELPPNSEAIAYKSKTLSLELLFSVLGNNCGAYFRSSKRFIEGVKEFLIMSLLRNCVSTDHEIFRLSLSIFVTLLSNFKEHLKSEIGLFLDNIFLKIGASSNSTFVQRLLVLQVFAKMCQDPQTIIDIFVNFDCDPSSINIFENMMLCLDKITKGRLASEGWITEQQESQLKIIALQSMVSILASIHKWYHDEQQLLLNSSSSQIRIDSAVQRGKDDDDKAGDDVPAEPSAQPKKPSGLTEHFEKQRQKKDEWNTAILKFNIDAKQGLNYMKKLGLVENTPEQIAKLFRETPGLAKDQMGLYMAKPADFNKAVLYAFVESFDFTDKPIDIALREFLGSFRIPGEAQQVDRIMEKFAEYFCSKNPAAFVNANVAFILCFSILMLNTDLYNPQVRNKMTKEDFVKSNLRIQKEYQLDVPYLESIYDRIASDEIKVLADNSAVASASNSPSSNGGAAMYGSDRKRTLFSQETANMVKKTQELMTDVKKLYTLSEYHVASIATDSEVLRPMFEICWPPALATFSILLQESDDRKVVQMCLEGYKFAIQISAGFGLNVQRHAFVNSLASFTYLGTPKEMKPKNIEAIKILLIIAFHEGNYLKESWEQILKCISEYERLLLIASGAKSDSFVFSRTAAEIPVQSSAASGLSSEDASLKNSVNLLLLSEIEPGLIDRIFTRSSALNSDAIVDFVEYLCLVSKSELESVANPRVFCLQKIVEITYYNMGRMRIVWQRIWSILCGLFELAGNHRNKNISIYAIDSLRQLASKFLEKDELMNYEFQKQFLQPFETIVRNNKNNWEIREFVIQCLNSLLLSRVSNVKSGWKVVLSIFSLIATEEPNERIVTETVEIVSLLIKDGNIAFLSECMNELVTCLVSFGSNSLTDLALQCIGYLEKIARILDTSPMYRLDANSLGFDESKDSSSVPVAASASIRVWFSLFAGLSLMTSDPRIEIRTRALSVLINILRTFGKNFTTEIWSLIFRSVLIPIFDRLERSTVQAFRLRLDIPVAPSPSAIDTDIVSENSWLRTTCVQGLETLTELFCQFFEICASELLSDMMTLFTVCFNQPNKEVAQTSLVCVKRLVQQKADAFTRQNWSVFFNSLRIAVISTLPSELSDKAIREQLGLPPSPAEAAVKEFSVYYAHPTEVPILSPAFFNMNLVAEKLEAENPAGPGRKLSLGLPFHPRSTYIRYAIHHMILDSLSTICETFFQHLSIEEILVAFETCLITVGFSRMFDYDSKLRQTLAQRGFALGELPTPQFFDQEARGLFVYMSLLSHVYVNSPSEVVEQVNAEERLLRVSHSVLDEFGSLDASEEARTEQNCKEEVVCLLLQFLCDLDPKSRLASTLIKDSLSSLVKMIGTSSVKVRDALKKVMLKHLVPRVLNGLDLSQDEKTQL